MSSYLRATCREQHGEWRKEYFSKNKTKSPPSDRLLTQLSACVSPSGVPAGQRHHQGHQQDISGSRLLQRHWRRRTRLPLQDLQGETHSAHMPQSAQRQQEKQWNGPLSVSAGTDLQRLVPQSASRIYSDLFRFFILFICYFYSYHYYQ